jgi:hypothetical protein
MHPQGLLVATTLSIIIVPLVSVMPPQDKDVVVMGENCSNGIANGHKMGKHIDNHRQSGQKNGMWSHFFVQVEA